MKKTQTLKNKPLVVLLSLFLFTGFFIEKSLAETVFYQSGPDFQIDMNTLDKGNIQIGLDYDITNSFFSNHPVLEELDIFNLSKIPYSRTLAAKGAFIVKKDISEFSQKKMQTLEAMNDISQNVTTSGLQRIDSEKITFFLNKRIMVYGLKSNVDFYYHDIRLGQKPIFSPIEKVISNMPDSFQPDIVTVQKTYNFSNFFNLASNICYYKSLAPKKTLITCYTTSSVTETSARTLRFFVDFKNSLAQELIYSFNQIRN
jgi:hypothetical protein